MAQASRQVRKIRRIKRERTIAFKMLELALEQRDYARMLLKAATTELAKREAEKDKVEDKVEIQPIPNESGE